MKQKDRYLLVGGLLHREPDFGPLTTTRYVLCTDGAHTLLGLPDALHPPRCIEVEKTQRGVESALGSDR